MSFYKNIAGELAKEIISGLFGSSRSGGYESYYLHDEKQMASPKRKRRKKKKPAPPQLKEQPHQTLWEKTEKYDSASLKLLRDCIKSIHLNKAESHVTKLQQKYKDKTPPEIVRILIIQKSFWVARVNLDTNAKGKKAIRIAESLLPGMAKTELKTIVKFLAETVYQIGIIYGQPLRYSEWRFEVLTVFGAAFLGEKAIKVGIDWLKEGLDFNKVISDEAKSLMFFALGNAACLFYEAKSNQNIDPFKRQNHFNRLAKKSQYYLSRYSSRRAVIKLIATEIEKAFPIDYSKLIELLESKNWKDADQETFNIMLKLMDREQREFCEFVSLMARIKHPLDISFLKLEEEDLNTINYLWLEATDGHFGFTAQKQVYLSASQNIGDFSKLVGWQGEAGWKSYEQMTFSLSAPKGHLPGFWLELPNLWKDEENKLADWLTAFFTRSDL